MTCLTFCLQVATEWVQGGGGSDQFSKLLGDVMRAADGGGDGDGDGDGDGKLGRLAELQKQVKGLARDDDGCA